MILGTAQLGLEYGIANRRGKPSEGEAQRLLETAWDVGFRALDTSAAYGDSEARIGRFIRSSAEVEREISIISKLEHAEEHSVELIRASAGRSCETLGLRGLSGFLVHDMNDLRRQPEVVADGMRAVRDSGLAGMVGASIYDAADINFLLSGEWTELVQLPFSLLDQRLAVSGHLEALHKRGVAIHARSVFTQGLLLLPEDSIPPGLADVVEARRAIDRIAAEAGITRKEMALGFLFAAAVIDDVVVGAESEEQIRELGAIAARADELREVIAKIDTTRLAVNREEIVNPSHWNRA